MENYFIKKIFLVLLLVIALSTVITTTFAADKKDRSKSRMVTAYYCIGSYGYCLSFPGTSSGNMSPGIIPGVLHVITIKVPAEYTNGFPGQEPGYQEVNKFFLHDPSSVDGETGIGLTDGLLDYKDASSPFYYYEFSDTPIITSYTEWQAAVQ